MEIVEWAGDRWALEELLLEADPSRALVEGVFTRLAPGETLWVGTAEGVPWGLAFYGACGFVRDHLVPGFFLKNYPQPVMDGGIRCIDMVYLRRKKEES